MDQGQLALEGNPQEVFRQRQVLEGLELGAPMLAELLALVGEVLNEERQYSGNLSSTQIEYLQQQILQSFRLG